MGSHGGLCPTYGISACIPFLLVPLVNQQAGFARLLCSWLSARHSRARREGKKAPASLLLLFHCLKLWSFGVWHLRASLTSSCPAQLGQLYRASFGVTLLVLSLYLPFIDNQLLDNEQVLVHLKDCLMGGGMVERKVYGI